MADEKETKLEIVDIPKPLKDLENTIRDVFPKIAKIGQDMGKDLAGAIIKAYENMGYEFREDDNNKLDYDAREKDLTRWFCESLENKINELSMAETLQN